MGGVVSLKRKLRTLLVCLPLLLGSMSGVPMRPEEVEELMQKMNEQQMVYVMPGVSEIGVEPQ